MSANGLKQTRRETQSISHHHRRKDRQNSSNLRAGCVRGDHCCRHHRGRGGHSLLRRTCPHFSKDFVSNPSVALAPLRGARLRRRVFRLPSWRGSAGTECPYLSLWGLKITGSDLKLEPAYGAVVTEIVARLRRIVTSKNNRQRVFVSIYRLRIIDPPAEEVRVVTAGRSYEWRRRGRWHPRCNLGGRQCVRTGDIHDRRIGRIGLRF